MLELQSRLRPKSEEVVAKVMDGEAIIINLATGVYYSLDRAGAAMWELIETGRRLHDVAAAVAARYEVTAEQAAHDVLQLASELVREEIMEIVALGDGVMHESPAPTGSKQSYSAPVLHAYRDMEDLLALDPPTPSLSDIPWKA